MTGKKRFLSILLCGSLLLTATSPVFAHSNSRTLKSTYWLEPGRLPDTAVLPEEAPTFRYGGTIKEAEPAAENGIAAMAADDGRIAFNTITAPSMDNGLSAQKLGDTGEESISPYSGELTLRYTDMTLPGRNGLDLEIGRIYQTAQAGIGAKQILTRPVENFQRDIHHSTILRLAAQYLFCRQVQFGCRLVVFLSQRTGCERV